MEKPNDAPKFKDKTVDPGFTPDLTGGVPQPPPRTDQVADPDAEAIAYQVNTMVGLDHSKQLDIDAAKVQGGFTKADERKISEHYEKQKKQAAASAEAKKLVTMMEYRMLTYLEAEELSKYLMLEEAKKLGGRSWSGAKRQAELRRRARILTTDAREHNLRTVCPCCGHYVRSLRRWLFENVVRACTGCIDNYRQYEWFNHPNDQWSVFNKFAFFQSAVKMLWEAQRQHDAIKLVGRLYAQVPVPQYRLQPTQWLTELPYPQFKELSPSEVQQYNSIIVMDVQNYVGAN